MIHWFVTVFDHLPRIGLLLPGSTLESPSPSLMFLHVCRYGSFHGQDDNLLLRRFSSCKRTPSYSKLLPQHSYEVDMPPKGGITVSSIWQIYFS